MRDAIRQDEKVDRKIAKNQDSFEALDFNAAAGDSRMSPASAFVATIRGNIHTHSITDVQVSQWWNNISYSSHFVELLTHGRAV